MTLTVEQTVVACLVLHVIADFTLQTLGNPSLVGMKQKSWWTNLLDRATDDIQFGSETAKRAFRDGLERKYGTDYKVALACHSITWSAITFLPLCTVPGWSAIVAANAGIHYLVDDLKANLHRINLIEDQVLHVLQIDLTLGAFWAVRLVLAYMKGAQ